LDALLEMAKVPSSGKTPPPDEDCPICLASLRPDDALVLSCGHQFHEQCIAALKAAGDDATCPMCRAPLPPAGIRFLDEAVMLFDGGKKDAQQLGQLQSLLQHSVKCGDMNVDSQALAHYMLGSVHGHLDDSAGEIEFYERAASLHPMGYMAAMIFTNLGGALQRAGNYPDAVVAFQRAIVQDPLFPLAHTNLGTVYGYMGQQEMAVISLKKGIGLGFRMKLDEKESPGAPVGRMAGYLDNCKFSSAFLNLSGALCNLGDFAACVAASKQATKFNAGCPMAFNNLGNALMGLGDFKGAVAALSHSMELSPNCISKRNLENARSVLLAPPGAEKSVVIGSRAESAILLAVEAHKAIFTKGALPDVNGAIEFAKEAIAMDPGNADAHVIYGVAMAKSGDVVALTRTRELFETSHFKNKHRYSDQELAGNLVYLRALEKDRLRDLEWLTEAQELMHQAEGNSRKAKELYNQAAGLLDKLVSSTSRGGCGFEHAPAHFSFGVVLRKLRHTQMSCMALKHAVELNSAYMEKLDTIEICNIGSLHMMGVDKAAGGRAYPEGFAQDASLAVPWLAIAAEAGLPYAQNLLGGCYFNGDGVTQDQERAVAWYRKSAESGFADGQKHLGECYLSGEGVVVDQVQAVAWFTKAADENGDRGGWVHGITQDKKPA
jgi:TPR repeat protein/Tfp pilus assembly protein PilF